MSQISEQSQSSMPNVELDPNHCFLFYFEVENCFDFCYANSPIWTAEYAPHFKKITLEKFQRIELERGCFGSFGCFIRHGRDTEIVPLTKYLDEEIKKGRQFYQMDLSTEALDHLQQIVICKQDGSSITLSQAAQRKEIVQNIVQQKPNLNNRLRRAVGAPTGIKSCPKCLKYTDEYKDEKVCYKKYNSHRPTV